MRLIGPKFLGKNFYGKIFTEKFLRKNFYGKIPSEKFLRRNFFGKIFTEKFLRKIFVKVKDSSIGSARLVENRLEKRHEHWSSRGNRSEIFREKLLSK